MIVIDAKGRDEQSRIGRLVRYFGPRLFAYSGCEACGEYVEEGDLPGSEERDVSLPACSGIFGGRKTTTGGNGKATSTNVDERRVARKNGGIFERIWHS